MARDQETTKRLNTLIGQLVQLTTDGQLHWERQLGSAHRYARWKNNLLILGPAEPLSEHLPRYLFITPFDSPACVEVNSGDKDLGGAVMQLVERVEQTSRNEPPTDPFAITEDVLSRLTE